jgi:hypothetical protein
MDRKGPCEPCDDMVSQPTKGWLVDRAISRCYVVGAIHDKSSGGVSCSPA